MTDAQKKMAAEFIANMAPEAFLEQFVKLIDLYENHKSKLNEDMTNKDRFNLKLNYINESYNIINVLIKYIAISSSDSDGLERLAPKNIAQKKAEEKPKKKEESNILDNMDMQEIEEPETSKAIAKYPAKKEKPKTKANKKEFLLNELDKWKLDKESFSYKALSSLDEISVHGIEVEETYTEIIKALSNKFHRSISTISSALCKTVSKYDRLKKSSIEDLRKLEFPINSHYAIVRLYNYLNEI